MRRDLDADVMRDDPPWAPFLNVARRDFVSKSFGCYFLHPVYRLDIAATCKETAGWDRRRLRRRVDEPRRAAQPTALGLAGSGL